MSNIKSIQMIAVRAGEGKRKKEKIFLSFFNFKF